MGKARGDQNPNPNPNPNPPPHPNPNQAAEGQQLPLKRLRKGTVAACQAHGGAAAKEELRATFDKKLAKMAAVETVGDSVRLARAP